MRYNRIAIVGSEEKYWTPEQRKNVVQRIAYILRFNMEYGQDDYMTDSITLVSGGCPKGGVDIWAEIVADSMGVPKKIYNPDCNRWKDLDDGGLTLTGYKSRNIEIAANCDVLYCFDPVDRDWSGGMWTMNHAKKLGKPVFHERF